MSHVEEHYYVNIISDGIALVLPPNYARLMKNTRGLRLILGDVTCS